MLEYAEDRYELIMLKNLPIMLCCNAPKNSLLYSTNFPIMLKIRVHNIYPQLRALRLLVIAITKFEIATWLSFP